MADFDRHQRGERQYPWNRYTNSRQKWTWSRGARASRTFAQMRIAVSVLPATTHLETAALSESRFALGTRP